MVNFNEYMNEIDFSGFKELFKIIIEKELQCKRSL
ncbi:hypothetical protein SAMN05444001_11297 [Parabacteroides chinchillae]|uniref:Uncharacterized protein n=1 Tax=Parabacteroides chinchillae TaxID=871327 RepID=A0A8G2BXC9_9BACT|nr:hypothetical protein SAMN05444001_11297 [Parabacteroides chinchillae]